MGFGADVYINGLCGDWREFLSFFDLSLLK